jgi:cell fate regulator YaaT (PSP1 superfamily)
MAKIIGVKFNKTSKVYYFAPESDNVAYEVGSGVIVETAQGLEYGTVALALREISDDKIEHALKPVVRKATPKDEKKIQENKAKVPSALEFASKKIAEMKLVMKLISAEYSFDGKKITFFFSSDNRVDFRELVKVLANGLKARIELRQVGVRDETKMLGGIAPCGRTCCCAGTFADFSKVTIKMAKNQGLHLNPSKISGLCGRLMCCLEYENEYYEKACKKVPKIGQTVKTVDGEGVVISNDMLKMISKIKITKPDGSEIYKDFSVKEITFKQKIAQKEEDDNLDTSLE